MLSRIYFNNHHSYICIMYFMFMLWVTSGDITWFWYSVIDFENKHIIFYISNDIYSVNYFKWFCKLSLILIPNTYTYNYVYLITKCIVQSLNFIQKRHETTPQEKIWNAHFEIYL